MIIEYTMLDNSRDMFVKGGTTESSKGFWDVFHYVCAS